MRNLLEDIVLWFAVAVFCIAMLVDYVTGSKISEWLV